MPTENSVITREHLPGLLLARTIWENGGPSLYFPPGLQDATDQARAALPAPASVPDGYMPIPTAEQMADALDGVRCYHDMSAELIAPELLANLLAAPTIKAEQVQCEVCHGQGEVYSGHDQHFHYFDFQPPEPIMEVCPECGGEEAPSLPAAGSAEEEVEVVAWRYRHSEQEKWQAGVERKSLWETEPLMTVAQHERIVAALSAQQSAQPEFCCEHSYKVAKQAAWGARDLTQCKCDHNEYCEHCWPDDFREGGKWRGKFVAQQSAPERGDGWIPVNERLPSMVQEVIVNSEFDGVTAGILDSYGEWYSPNSDYKLTRVVAWQPLPAAPSLLATHRGQASGCHSEGDQNE